MKLIFADPHIEEKAIPELRKIFNEIIKYEADELIMLGDYYDKSHPSSQEMLFGTEWAYKFKEKYKTVYFLAGNHDKTRDISAIDYLKYFGINVVDSYLDEGNNFYGHFMTNKSTFEYGTHEKTVAQLKKYNNVFLGHQHEYQHIPKSIYHVGSCRYINFNEATDENKFIVLLNNKQSSYEFINLKSVIPMRDVTSLDELEDIEFDTKVRLIINEFSNFKVWAQYLQEYKKKFIEFRVKLNFNIFNDKKVKEVNSSKHKKLQDILNEGLKQIEDEDVRKMLLEQFEEN